MPVFLRGNYFQSTNASTMTNAATSATLVSTAGFVVPAAGQLGVVRVDDVNAVGYNQVTGPFEIIYYTTNTTGTNTLSGFNRGQEGTAAHAFAAGATWSQVVTAGSLSASLMALLGDSGDLNGLSTTSFQNIPQTYGSLLLVSKLRHNAAVISANVGLRFNSDSTSPHYYSQSWFGTNNVPSYFNTTDQSQLQQGLLSAGTTNADYATSLFIVPGYGQADSSHNTMQMATHFQVLQLNGGLWQPSVAQGITRIDTISPGAAYVSGSRIRLYGLP